MALAEDIRRAQLAKIHIAKTRLGLTDELYRSIIARISGGKTSSAALDSRQRGQLLDEMGRLGFAETPPPAPATAAPGQPQLAKIRKLWQLLGNAGALDKLATGERDAALRKFAKRITGRDALEWLTEADARKVIEGLKAWLVRVANKENGNSDLQ